MKQRGFTLVELLIVIAVIAILAAMLAPVFLQAKESSRMRVCASNLRQLGQAIVNYIEDNNGYGLPQKSPKENPWILWMDPLLPQYVPGTKAQVRTYLRPVQNPPPPVPRQPKCLWVCSGDIYRGPEEPDQPYWWNFGSSYMYPGPRAYVHSTQPNQYDRENLTPRKPFAWLNHKRDFLLMDYWYDFHSGGRRVGHVRVGDVTPDMLLNVQDVKSINALFLDMHLKVLTMGERKKYMNYVISPPRVDKECVPGDNPYPDAASWDGQQ